MAKHIHQYVRNGKKIVGVLMGTKCEDGSVIITASKAAISKGDKFDKEFGKNLCIARANAYTDENRIPIIPESMKDDAKSFMERCSKYFKVKTVSFFTDFDKSMADRKRFRCP